MVKNKGWRQSFIYLWEWFWKMILGRPNPQGHPSQGHPIWKMIYLFRAGQLASRIIYLFWLPLNYYCHLWPQRTRSRICWSESFDSKIESARANNWPWSKQTRSQPQPPIGSSSLWQRKQPDFRFGFCQKSAVLKSAALSCTCGCDVVVTYVRTALVCRATWDVTSFIY